jgi:hypothetical protein
MVDAAGTPAFADMWTQVLLAVFLLMFGFLLLATGLFTAYFGSGKSRQIGGGLTFTGILILTLVVVLFYTDTFGTNLLFKSNMPLWETVLFPMIVILAGAGLGAGAAIGLFLFAIMKA